MRLEDVRNAMNSLASDPIPLGWEPVVRVLGEYVIRFGQIEREALTSHLVDDRNFLLHHEVRAIDYFALPGKAGIPLQNGGALIESDLRARIPKPDDVTLAPLPHVWRPTMHAIGEYIIYFGQVEEALRVLFTLGRSASPQGHVDFCKWLEAEACIDENRDSAGEFAGELRELILGALDGEFETQTRARAVLRELEPQSRRVIRDRNMLLHRELRRIDHLADTGEAGIPLQDGGALTESGLQARARKARGFTSGLRSFLWKFVSARKSTVG